jgi:hypothetical protein
VGVDAHLVHRVDGSGCGGSDASHLEDLGVVGGWGGELAREGRNADGVRVSWRQGPLHVADVREKRRSGRQSWAMGAT